MSLFRCSVCGERPPGKLAVAYWAWFNANNERCAWKVRYCARDAGKYLNELLRTLHSGTVSTEVFACCSCGMDASEDSDPCYLTLYVPGREPEEFAIQLDSACAAKFRLPITSSGERLPDRSSQVRGPSPLTSAWDQLGIAPPA